MFLVKILINIVILFGPCMAQDLIKMENAPLSEKEKKHITKGDHLIRVEVTDLNAPLKITGQKLDLEGFAIHKKNCSIALRTISRYEEYPKHLSFIKSGSYIKKTSRINFLLSHLLLPFDMRLNFVMPRVNKPGVYNFIFDKGFLKGLKGQIHVSNYKSKCFFYITTNWQGPNTKIPNSVLELFSSVLAKLTYRNLFRISGSPPN